MAGYGGGRSAVTGDGMSGREGGGLPPPAGIDAGVPNSARIWNYWLGGKDNFAADRAVGEQVRAMFPQIAAVARAQRDFLARAVSYLAGPAGIRQFLDVGTGLPSAEATHEVAQRVAAGCRVVYVDNDPVVAVHARALLTGGPGGATAFVRADLRDTAGILAAAAQSLDLTQPVALLLLGILGHVADHGEAVAIVRELLAGLAAGSYLVVADGADTSEAGNQAQARYNQQAPVPYHLRSPGQIAAFFGGLQLVEPGVVSCSQWRPDPAFGGWQPEAAVYCGVARKAERETPVNAPE
jgi:O-methyltransferase involved in polyketide biosynthesis